MSGSNANVRFLLDTDAVSSLARRPSGSVAVRVREQGAECVAISAITLAEIRFGLARVESPRLVAQVTAILTRLPTLPFDEAAALHYGEIRATLQRAGTPIGPNDLLIAAHARSLGIGLVTRNVREFSRVPELVVEDWLADD